MTFLRPGHQHPKLQIQPWPPQGSETCVSTPAAGHMPGWCLVGLITRPHGGGGELLGTSELGGTQESLGPWGVGLPVTLGPNVEPGLEPGLSRTTPKPPASASLWGHSGARGSNSGLVGPSDHTPLCLDLAAPCPAPPLPVAPQHPQGKAQPLSGLALHLPSPTGVLGPRCSLGSQHFQQEPWG